MSSGTWRWGIYTIKLVSKAIHISPTPSAQKTKIEQKYIFNKIYFGACIWDTNCEMEMLLNNGYYYF